MRSRYAYDSKIVPRYTTVGNKAMFTVAFGMEHIWSRLALFGLVRALDGHSAFCRSAVGEAELAFSCIHVCRLFA